MANRKVPDFQTVVLKNSIVPGRVPAPSDLQIGELALSLYRGEESIWAKNSNGDVVKLNSITVNDLWSKDYGVFKSYSSYDAFQEALAAGSISPQSIVFVGDEEHRGIWTQGIFYDSLDPEQYITVDDIATEEKNGLLSKEDKAKLDELFGGDIEVARPIISGEWNIYNNAGTFVRTSQEKILDLEYGYLVQWEGTYTWHSEYDHKSPVRVSADSDWKTLVNEGETSSIYQTEIINNDKTIKIEFLAPQDGYTINKDNIVVPAFGSDNSVDQVEVMFLHKIYYGTTLSSNPNESVIKNLSSILSKTRNHLVEGVSCEEDEYYCFAYPQELGELHNIIQDEVTAVLGAFTMHPLQITNDAGLTVDLYVYISNNPGAFTTTSLEFK